MLSWTTHACCLLAGASGEMVICVCLCLGDSLDLRARWAARFYGVAVLMVRRPIEIISVDRLKSLKFTQERKGECC
ncbi:hypothetical protein K440DRAFT_634266 [Wilcoxina mikolae CBS 423.85]|nr:hypothetical protein K440DRAFT_634266 [Wilcoxina mikolae CBS 423.85]